MNEFREKKERFEKLLEGLRSTSADTRKNACKALAQMAVAGESFVVGPLIRLLGSSDYLVRYNAAAALGKIGDKRAVKPLITKLKDEKRWVRLAASEALGLLGDPRANEHLLERLHDSFDKAREAAFRSLCQLGDGRIASAIKEENVNSYIRIAKTGDPRPIELMLDYYQKSHDLDKQGMQILKKSLMDVYNYYNKRTSKILCKEHYHRFASLNHPHIKLSLTKKLPYFACRKCGRTLYAVNGINKVAVVLDEDYSVEVEMDSTSCRVNYFVYKDMFDFNEVEIIKASEKAIEQFCYLIHQDDDPFRKGGYKKMTCMVHKSANVSGNSMAILKNLFKKVIIAA